MRVVLPSRARTELKTFKVLDQALKSEFLLYLFVKDTQNSHDLFHRFRSRFLVRPLKSTRLGGIVILTFSLVQTFQDNLVVTANEESYTCYAYDSLIREKGDI